jgi:hypothetical protein
MEETQEFGIGREGENLESSGIWENYAFLRNEIN